MGVRTLFSGEDIQTVSEALDIAEDRTGEYYKFSFGQWKRHRYGVKTLADLRREEIAPDPAFALLNKYSWANAEEALDIRRLKGDYYSICLQDHRILEALGRDRNACLLPLMVYIFTHELIHIVRFCNFSQRFEVKGEGRRREEEIVHGTTLKVLKGLALQDLDYIMDAYRSYGICELMAC
jgi:hypothetical protein